MARSPTIPWPDHLPVDGACGLSGEHTGEVTLDVAGHPVAIALPALPRR